MVVRVASPLASGTRISNATYSIDSNETAAVSGAAISTSVTSAPVLTVSQTDAPDPLPAGGDLTYTITYGNSGNANATGVLIADTVPANTTFVSATGGGTLSGGVVTWSIGNLAAGGSGSVQIFFFNDTATTEIYTLSLHDALPICNETAAVSGAAISTSV